MRFVRCSVEWWLQPNIRRQYQLYINLFRYILYSNQRAIQQIRSHVSIIRPRGTSLCSESNDLNRDVTKEASKNFGKHLLLYHIWCSICDDRRKEMNDNSNRRKKRPNEILKWNDMIWKGKMSVDIRFNDTNGGVQQPNQRTCFTFR